MTKSTPFICLVLGLVLGVLLLDASDPSEIGADEAATEHTGRFLAAMGLGVVSAFYFYRRAKQAGLYGDPKAPWEMGPHPTYVPGTFKFVLMAIGFTIIVQTGLLWVRPVTGEIVAAELLGVENGVDLTVATEDGPVGINVDFEWFASRNRKLSLVGLQVVRADELEALDLPAFSPEPITVYRSLIGGNRLSTWGDALVHWVVAAFLAYMFSWVRYYIRYYARSWRSSRSDGESNAPTLESV